MMVNGSKVNISAPVYQRSMDHRALVSSFFFIQAHYMRLYSVFLWFLHSRSLRLCSYAVAVCDCVFHLYDFFFLLLSSVNIFFLTYMSGMTSPILTILGHKYRLTIPFMSWDQIGVKGQVGVIGVKKVIFAKNATSSTDYVA